MYWRVGEGITVVVMGGWSLGIVVMVGGGV